MKSNLLYIIALVAGLYFNSCSDDNVPADADQNFITSATFTINDTTYEAVINNNEVTITVPYTVSLDKAKASFAYTSSAKVYPDPATITDWDNERSFRVVSYNGKDNVYTYRVIKDEIRQDGDITLANAAQITSFAESNVTVINGNLTIGADDGDAIADIKEMVKLKQIVGKLIIKNTYKGGDLTGLDNLQSIGGLVIGDSVNWSSSPIYQVSFPALTKVTGNVIIRNNSTKWLMASELTEIKGDLSLHSSDLQSIQLEKLSSVGANFDIQCIDGKNSDGTPKMGGTIVSLNLPELTTVGDTISANYIENLKNIDLQKLQSAGGIMFATLPLDFEKIDLSSLQAVEGDLNLTSTIVTSAIGSLVSRNETLTSFGNLDRLHKVGGTLTLANFVNVDQLPVPKELGGYYLFHLDKAKTTLDFSKTTFLKQNNTESQIRISYTPIAKITGKTVMDCFLNIDRIYLRDGFPAIEGIETINNFRIFIDGSYADLHDPITFNFKKVLGNFHFDGQYVSVQGSTTYAVPALHFSNLESVGGYFYISKTNFFAPLLRTVGGQFHIHQLTYVTDFDISKLESVGTTSSATFDREDYSFYMAFTKFENGTIIRYPSLKKVGGAGMCVDLGGSNANTTELDCPKLEQVDGTLRIMGSLRPLSRLWNKTVTDLKFPLLKKAENIIIEKFTILSDFSSFETLFNNNGITESRWNVVNCEYNPTYQNMIDGKYSK